MRVSHFFRRIEVSTAFPFAKVDVGGRGSSIFGRFWRSSGRYFAMRGRLDPHFGPMKGRLEKSEKETIR